MPSPVTLMLLALYSGHALLVSALSLWLLLNAQTWVGRGLALAGFVLVPLPLLVAGWYRQRERSWGLVLALAVLIIAVFLLALFLATPSGNPGPRSPVQHRFTSETGFCRYCPANLIPEIEQVNLGFLLMPYLDPYLTREQARRVSTSTLDLYREMEADPDFRELGSVMGLAYRGLLGRPANAGHYYRYVPHNPTGEPLPALIFLHGAAGNFKAYTWIWSKLAEEEGFVLIAPTYGFGTWDEQGEALVLQVLADARQVAPLDPDRLYLAGLSNGGIGVSRLAAARPDLWRGLIFLSPVMPPAIVDAPAFHAQWANRPVLILTGAADRRIPLAYVDERMARLESGGVDVTSVIYPGEDHFLVFSRPERIRQDLAGWLAETGAR